MATHDTDWPHAHYHTRAAQLAHTLTLLLCPGPQPWVVSVGVRVREIVRSTRESLTLVCNVWGARCCCCQLTAWYQHRGFNTSSVCFVVLYCFVLFCLKKCEWFGVGQYTYREEIKTDHTKNKKIYHPDSQKFCLPFNWNWNKNSLILCY